MCYRQQLPQVYSGAITEETLLRVCMCVSLWTLLMKFTHSWTSSWRNLVLAWIHCMLKQENYTWSISKDLKEGLFSDWKNKKYLLKTSEKARSPLCTPFSRSQPVVVLCCSYADNAVRSEECLVCHYGKRHYREQAVQVSLKNTLPCLTEWKTIFHGAFDWLTIDFDHVTAKSKAFF